MSEENYDELRLHVPTHLCPVHGKVTCNVTFSFDDELKEDSVTFCQKCIRDFLAKNLPEIKRVEEK